MTSANDGGIAAHADSHSAVGPQAISRLVMLAACCLKETPLPPAKFRSLCSSVSSLAPGALELCVNISRQEENGAGEPGRLLPSGASPEKELERSYIAFLRAAAQSVVTAWSHSGRVRLADPLVVLRCTERILGSFSQGDGRLCSQMHLRCAARVFTSLAAPLTTCASASVSAQAHEFREVAALYARHLRSASGTTGASADAAIVMLAIELLMRLQALHEPLAEVELVDYVADLCCLLDFGLRRSGAAAAAAAGELRSAPLRHAVKRGAVHRLDCSALAAGERTGRFAMLYHTWRSRGARASAGARAGRRARQGRAIVADAVVPAAPAAALAGCEALALLGRCDSGESSDRGGVLTPASLAASDSAAADARRQLQRRLLVAALGLQGGNAAAVRSWLRRRNAENHR
eukprot:TRINITY_DN50503_c0_g1_i1.p1 TRINITY_DN50503_c0_g1~~TRINITY_DN50503_c0_g1_i1.p1  ORF type:complete len:406 (-),score=78.19 TRINITY_DN50503_c0_g1_i1:367-1584(-)